MGREAHLPLVLVIDDEPDVTTYLKRLLEDHGYRTLAATNGTRGLELARNHTPGLICLDISMPAPSGLRVYRELNSDPRTCSIPVVMVTGVPPQFRQYIRHSERISPPADYIAKPFDPDELLTTVGHFLPPGPEAVPPGT